MEDITTLATPDPVMILDRKEAFESGVLFNSRYKSSKSRSLNTKEQKKVLIKKKKVILC